MNNFFKGAVGKVVECVDVDGCIRRVEINDLLNRVDWNALIDQIDLDRALDRLDWNRQLKRIDIDALLEHIDIEEIINRSNVSNIVMESTNSIFSQFLDSIRIHVVLVDLFVLRMTRFRFRESAGVLPGRPGGTREDRHTPIPKSKYEKAIAVQGRYAGFFSKAIAIILDISFVTFSFAVLLVVVELCHQIFKGGILHGSFQRENTKQREKIDKDNMIVFFIYYCYWFLYFWLAVLLTGQTLGMAIIGLKVKEKSAKKEISPFQALIRTAFLPLTLSLFPPLGFIGCCRHDGRMLHDLLAGTGIIYVWNARVAKMRQKALRRMERSMIRYPSEISNDGSEFSSNQTTYASSLIQPYNDVDAYSLTRAGEHEPLVQHV